MNEEDRIEFTYGTFFFGSYSKPWEDAHSLPDYIRFEPTSDGVTIERVEVNEPHYIDVVTREVTLA